MAGRAWAAGRGRNSARAWRESGAPGARRCRGNRARRPPLRRSLPPVLPVRARPPRSRDRLASLWEELPAAAGRSALVSRWLPALSDEFQHLLTLLAPGIELVRLEAVLPNGLGCVLFAREPVRTPELVIGLDQIRA